MDFVAERFEVFWVEAEVLQGDCDGLAMDMSYWLALELDTRELTPATA